MNTDSEQQPPPRLNNRQLSSYKRQMAKLDAEIRESQRYRAQLSEAIATEEKRREMEGK